MKHTNRTLLISIIILLFVALAACRGQETTPAAEDAPGIPLEDCILSAPGSPTRTPAQCGTFTVYEDRAAGAGRQIDLRIAVLPAISRNPAPDPLFFLTGGPGQAATESFLLLQRAFMRLNQDRDIVLIDQRGTGQSHPLRCTPPEETAADSATTDLLAACLAQLDADPRFYTTSIAMADLDAVREALGYEQINLYGVSYGTRAAFTYMRAYPGRVRTVVLDGVAPPQLALGLGLATDAQRALDLIFTRCAADPDCQEKFPALEATFAALMADLTANPADVSLRHPITGEMFEMTLEPGMVAGAVRLLSYAPESVALLPLLLHNAQTKGELNLLAAQYLIITHELETSITNGMGFSVLCAEDVPFFTAEQAAIANEGTFIGNGETDNLLEICEVWPRGDTPPDFKDAVSGDWPVLLLSGEYDPVTPPAYGDLAAETLPNSLHIVAPGQGHNVVGRGCIPKLTRSFIETGTLEDLDTACAAESAPFPFFVNFSGPTP